MQRRDFNRPRVTPSILALVLLLAASPAYAGKSWKPRFLPKKGSVQHFAVSSDLTMSANLGLLGSRSGKLKLRVELRQRVTERRRRGPTVLELTYDRTQLDLEWAERRLSYDSAEPPPGGDEQAHRYLGRLVGQVVTLVVSRRGEIVEARGLEGLWDDGDSDAMLETLTQGLGLEMLKAVYQQSSPVFPGKRVRPGDRWSSAWTVPDPAFGAMWIDADYELLELGKIGRHKHVKTIVRNRIELDGRGPLLDRIGAMAGTEGEIRVTTDGAKGSGTIWTERKTGVTLGLLAGQQIELRLSVPLKVLGMTRRVDVPVSLEQSISFERME